MLEEKMKGWIGKILRVDLTAGEISEETLDPEVAKDYIGGRGLGIYSKCESRANEKDAPIS